MSFRFKTFFFIVRRDKISLFRFLLEGYDGLAILTTIDVNKGLVRILVPESREVELWQLLSAISTELVRHSASKI
jgi:hypothetical protein